MILPFMGMLIALNFVMNCPGLTPLAPKAGPMGGAGVAAPAGAWSLNCVVISFLAMVASRRLSTSALGAEISLVDNRHVHLFASGAAQLARVGKDVGDRWLAGRLTR